MLQLPSDPSEPALTPTRTFHYSWGRQETPPPPPPRTFPISLCALCSTTRHSSYTFQADCQTDRPQWTTTGSLAHPLSFSQCQHNVNFQDIQRPDFQRNQTIRSQTPALKHRPPKDPPSLPLGQSCTATKRSPNSQLKSTTASPPTILKQRQQPPPHPPSLPLPSPSQPQQTCPSDWHSSPPAS